MNVNKESKKDNQNDVININEEKRELISDKDYLKIMENSNNNAEITAIRGRIIKKIKNLIKRLEKKANKTQEEIELIEQLKNGLSIEVGKHKVQLHDRYLNEFIDKDMKFVDNFTMLPRGLSIQVKRVVNSINEIKTAKTFKEKVKGVVNTGKQLGLTVATPVVFAGKFMLEHWYLALLAFGLTKAKEAKADNMNLSNPSNISYDNSINEGITNNDISVNEKLTPNAVSGLKIEKELDNNYDASSIFNNYPKPGDGMTYYTNDIYDHVDVNRLSR